MSVVTLHGFMHLGERLLARQLEVQPRAEESKRRSPKVGERR